MLPSGGSWLEQCYITSSIAVSRRNAFQLGQQVCLETELSLDLRHPSLDALECLVILVVLVQGQANKLVVPLGLHLQNFSGHCSHGQRAISEDQR